MASERLGFEGHGVIPVGAGGIGAACAQGFAELGAKKPVTVLEGDRARSLAEALELEVNGGGSMALDPTDASGCREAMKIAHDRLGG